MRLDPARLPAPFASWLDGAGPRPRLHLARGMNPGFWAFLSSLLLVAPLIFFGDLAARGVRGVPLERGDAVFGVAFVALGGWVLRRLAREVRDHRAIQAGALRLGVFVGDEGVLWRPSRGEAWVFAPGTVTSIALSAVSHGKTGPAPEAFTLVTTAGEPVTFGNAGDYAAHDVVRALAEAFPTATVHVDPALARWGRQR